VTWREILHQVLSVYAVRSWSERLDEGCSAFKPSMALFRSFLPRAG
jgi:hypothetical protein